MRYGLTVLGVTAVAVAAVAVTGCGSSGQRSAGRTPAARSETAATSTTAATRLPGVTGPAARPPARIVVPAAIIRNAQGSVDAGFVKLTIKGQLYIFKVDTGATSTIVDSTVAQALALPDRGPATTLTALCAKSFAQPVAISDWKLGGATLPAMTIASEATGFAGTTYQGLPFGGLLGADVLSRFGTMTLDFAGKRLTLGGKAPSGGQGLPAVIGRLPSGGVIVLVQAAIDGKPVGYQIDTGAGSTTIDSRVARRLGLKAAGKSRKALGIGCSTMITPVRIGDWTAGGVTLPATIAVSSLNGITDLSKGKIVGLLGAPLMATFGEVTIDFTGKRVVLGGTVG